MFTSTAIGGFSVLSEQTNSSARLWQQSKQQFLALDTDNCSALDKNNKQSNRGGEREITLILHAYTN